LNTSSHLQVPLQEYFVNVTRPLYCALLALACGALLGACGADEGDRNADAKRVLEQTFSASTSAIETGRLDARLTLAPEGLLALGGPISLRLTGPFAAPAGGELPRLDFAIAATLANQNFSAGAISTGTKAFVELDGRAYAIDDAFVRELRSGSGSKPKPKAGLQALGVDPLRWINDPVTKANERVAGVDTVRVSGTVNVGRLLEDLDKLLTKAGGSGGASGDLLTPALRKQIADAVDRAAIDVWSGASDKLLRQLAVAIDFAFKDGKPSPISGLDAGKLRLRLRLHDVNKTVVKITAPKRARALSELTGGGLGNFLRGIGVGLTGGQGSSDLGAAFLQCLTQANGKSAEIVRCASKLDK
jgi:hypothetical protein